MGKALAFVMLPVYTRYLTPADYGTMALIELTLDLVSLIAGVQIASGVLRYYHETRNRPDRRSLVSTAFLMLAGTHAAFGAVTFAGASILSQAIFGTPDHAHLIRLASAALAFQGSLHVPLAYARVRDLSGVFVFLNLARLSLAVLLNAVALIHFRMGVQGIFVSNLLASATVALGATAWLVRGVGLDVSREAALRLTRYGAPLIAMQFATFVVAFADRYFLQAAAGEATVGLYNLSYQFAFLLGLVGSAPYEQLWGPRRFKLARTLSQRHEVFARAFVYQNLLLVSAAVGIDLFAQDVLRLMTAAPFHAASNVVPILLLAYLLQGWCATQDVGIHVRERTEILAGVNAVAALVALVAYAALIPPWKEYGAAVATLLALATRWALTYRYSQRLWPIRYRWQPIVGLGLSAIGVTGLRKVLPDLSLASSLFIDASFFAGFCWIAWKTRVLSEVEREQIRTWLRRALRGLAPRTRVSALRRTLPSSLPVARDDEAGA